MRLIQLHATKRGCRLFRNNTGVARTADGSTIRFGLCVGSSDLIGWTSTGRFLAVEVKTPTGRTSQEQDRFISAVRSMGGLAGVCRSVQDLDTLLGVAV